jgi:hypothetical protein
MGITPVAQRTKALVQWLLLRAETHVCEQCSGPVYFWKRRVWLIENESCAHISCWETQRSFQKHIQTMGAATQKFKASQNPDPYREDVRATASDLRVAVLRLEQAVCGKDFSDAKPRMQEVLVLARMLDDLLRQWPDYA